MQGNWDGFYKYDNPDFQKATGFEQTNFKLNIQKSEGNTFEGTVNDDQATGGMQGTGRIVGTLRGNKVSFRKYMPYGREIDLEGNHYSTGKPHAILYYSGTLSKDKQHASGRWKFSYKIHMLFGMLPIPYRPGMGTWEAIISR